MKAIIVYYSLEGNTEYTAERIGKKLGADLLKIEPVKKYPTGKISKFFFGGMDAVRGKKPELKPYHFNAAEYDTIILATPVWAGSFAPPLGTFLSEQSLKGKEIGFAACSGSGDAESCFNKLKNVLKGENVKAVLSLAEPLNRKKEKDIEAIEAFCRQMES